MKLRDIFVITIALAILYVLIAKSQVFVSLANKIGEWTRNGIQALTTGSVPQ